MQYTFKAKQVGPIIYGLSIGFKLKLTGSATVEATSEIENAENGIATWKSVSFNSDGECYVTAQNAAIRVTATTDCTLTVTEGTERELTEYRVGTEVTSAGKGASYISDPVTGVVRLTSPSGGFLDSRIFGHQGCGTPIYTSGGLYERLLDYVTIDTKTLSENALIRISSVWRCKSNTGAVSRVSVVMSPENGGITGGTRVVAGQSSGNESTLRFDSFIQFSGSRRRQVSGLATSATGSGKIESTPVFSTYDFESNNLEIYFTGENTGPSADFTGLLGWSIEIDNGGVR